MVNKKSININYKNQLKTMKTTKNLIAMLMIASLFIFTACTDDDEEVVNTHDDAYVDVLTKKMSMMGNIKYLPIFFAGGEEIVEEGSSVTGPDGTEYDLHSFWAGAGKLTGAGAMANEAPPAGTYTFTLKFSDGYVKTLTDELEGAESTVPMISVTYNAETNPQTIEVSWTESPEADLYCVKLTELDMANTKPLYKVPMLDKTNTSHTIVLDGSNGWMRPVSDLQDGTQYFVVISAKKVEEGTEVTGASQNFEINACSKTKITYQE